MASTGQSPSSMPVGSGNRGPRRPSSPGGRGKPPVRSRRKPWGAIVALVVVAGVAAVIGKFWSMVNHIGGAGGANSVIAGIRNPRGQFPDKSNRITILLAGIDYSYTWVKNNVALNGARYTKDSRSDTIMHLSLDMNTQKVSALSIPRDTWVTAPDGQSGKINGTYRRGGPKLLAATVAQLLGVTPDYYIVVKPDVVKAVVDKLGGVEVETIDAIKYDDATAGLHIDLPQGRQIINGEQAVGFARFREADVYERQPNGLPIYTGEKDSAGNPIFKRKRTIVHSKEEGDSHRTARQQQLIRAMASKGKSLTNFFQLDQIVEAGVSQLQTDLSRSQMFALVALFRTFQPEQMQAGTLEGKGAKFPSGTYYFQIDNEKKRAMVDWLLKGDESAANRLTVVTVQNGTDVRGAARRVADRLRQEGFDAKPDTSLPSTGEMPATRIVYGKAMFASRAQRIAQLLGVSSAQVRKEAALIPTPEPAASSAHRHTAVDTSERADVTVILGRDLAAVNGQRSAHR